MSVRTIYKCDRCGAEQVKADQFWVVGVTASPINYPSSTHVSGKSMQVCRPCLESLGIHAQVPKPGQPPPPEPPSLEDLIREIVRQEIPNAD